MTMLRLEARVSCPLIEEILECTVEVAQGFLQCHAVYFGQPRSFLALLEVSEQSTGFRVANGLAVRVPLVAADSEEMVVHETGTAERPMDETRLRRIRIDAELVAERVRFHFFHFLCDVF